MSLGKQLRAAREARKMTQDDVEARFDLSHGVINQIEAGQQAGLYVSQLQRMADFFKCAFIVYPREAPTTGQRRVDSKQV